MSDIKNKFEFNVHEFVAAYVPQYQEVIKNKPWVYYGDDNIFPNHLLALYQYSSINRACINAITYGVKGKNLTVLEGDHSRIAMANRSETLLPHIPILGLNPGLTPIKGCSPVPSTNLPTRI